MKGFKMYVMKILYTLFFFFMFINMDVNAQGNLQFNKVKLIGVQIDTIPIGKVWKVESILPFNYPSSISIDINGQTIYISSFF